MSFCKVSQSESLAGRVEVRRAGWASSLAEAAHVSFGPVLKRSPFVSVCAQSASSSAHRVLIGTSLFITECISEKDRGGDTMPGLPKELVDIILDFVIAQVRESREGVALCKLMHTS